MDPHDAMLPDLPAGYRASVRGGTRLVARDDAHDALASALADTLADVLVDALADARPGRTLHGWAAAQAGARPLAGRAVAWAVRLAGVGDVVVRHSRHGGLLGRITGDVFLAPSRAPRELAASLRLQAAGVPTPDVIGYATYATMGPFRRADVVTGLVRGADLPEAWAAGPDDAARHRIAAAIARLVAALGRAGAVHPDLNVKNVLVSEAAGETLAWVLDVDRVAFTRARPGDAAARNLARLERSVLKWRRERGFTLGANAWAAIVEGARHQLLAASASRPAARDTTARAGRGT